MRLTPQLRDSFEQSPQSRLYLAYAQRVAELDHPKRALRILRDDVRLGAYQRAIANEVAGAALARSLTHHSWFDKPLPRQACHRAGGGHGRSPRPLRGCGGMRRARCGATRVLAPFCH
jgi:hypothetical protein